MLGGEGFTPHHEHVQDKGLNTIDPIKFDWAHCSLAVCTSEVCLLTELGWAHFKGTRLGTLQGAVRPRDVC